MPPTPAANGDDELMVAALIQFAANKLDAKQFARDFYGEENPTRSQVESGRLQWKNFMKRLEKKVGRQIMVATPKKETGGATEKGSGKGKKRKTGVEEEDMGDEGDAAEIVTPTPSPKKMKKYRAAGKFKEEDVAFASGGFEEQIFGDGVVAGHGTELDFEFYT
jgi:hypothetical protein